MRRCTAFIFLSLVIGPARGTDLLVDYIMMPQDLAQAEQEVFDVILSDLSTQNLDRATEQLNALTARLADSPAKPILIGNLGIMKALAGNSDEAVQHLSDAVSQVDENVGPFSETLVDLLVARAIINVNSGAMEQAEDDLRRAQHITHRQQGVYNESQLPIIQQLTAVHLAKGMILSADREQRFNLRINEQVLGEDSEGLVPVLASVGSYFASRADTFPVLPATPSIEMKSQAEAFTTPYRTALFRESIDLFERAIDIIETKYGENDLRLVPLLKDLASARLLQGSSARFAESAHERAARIVTSNPDTDIPDRAAALVDLADIYTITGDGRAKKTYREAWALLQEPAYEGTRNELFGTPKRLFPEEVRIIAINRQPLSVEEGTHLYADVEYQVMDNGRVASIKIVDSNVPNGDLASLRSVLRGTKFRPRMVDGDPVATKGMSLHQTFRVWPRDPTFDASMKASPTGP